MEKIVIISGYFNPLHLGHLKMIQDAKEMGDKLVVIVNNDQQQKLKKGKIIMDENERLEIVKALRDVDEVLIAIDRDPTVCLSIEQVAQNYLNSSIIFANGGDRNHPENIPESAVCEKYGIDLVFGTGGDYKLNSSSNINRLRGEEK